MRNLTEALALRHSTDCPKAEGARGRWRARQVERGNPGWQMQLRSAAHDLAPRVHHCHWLCEAVLVHRVPIRAADGTGCSGSEADAALEQCRLLLDERRFVRGHQIHLGLLLLELPLELPHDLLANSALVAKPPPVFSAACLQFAAP